METVLFLAADSARSRAYAQALAAGSLNPVNVLIYGAGATHLPGTVPVVVPDSASLDIFIPDLSIPLEQTCDKKGWSYQVVDAEHINDQLIVDFVIGGTFELIIYSGFGSQIVGAPLLNTGIPFLHIHAGRLPDYRGSTTVYYSIIDQARCDVTAILLESEIDKGPVVATKSYPIPNRGIDIDYLYDNAMRADLLVDVMSHYAAHGQLPAQTSQPIDSKIGPFYIIHPVLKHIALLSLPED